MAWECVENKRKTKRDELEEKYGIKIMNTTEIEGVKRFLELTAPFLKMLGIRAIWSHADLRADDRDALGIYSRFRYRDVRKYGRIVLDIDPRTLERVTARFDNRFRGGVMVCAGSTDWCIAVAYDKVRNNFVVGDIVHSAEDYDREEVREFVLAIVGVMFALAGKPLPPVATPAMNKAYRDAVRTMRIVDAFAGIATGLIKTVFETPATLPFAIRGRCRKAEFFISGHKVIINIPIKRKGGRIIVNRGFIKNYRDLDIPSTVLPFSVEGSITLEYRMGGDMVLAGATGKVVVKLPNGDVVKHPNISEGGGSCLGTLESKISSFSYEDIDAKEFCGWVDDIATMLETMLANPHIDTSDDRWGGPMLGWLQMNLRKYSEELARMIYGAGDDDDEGDDYDDYEDDDYE